MNGVTTDARITLGQPSAGLGAPSEYGPEPDPAAGEPSAGNPPADDPPAGNLPAGNPPVGNPGADTPGGGTPGGGTPGGGTPGGGTPGGGTPASDLPESRTSGAATAYPGTRTAGLPPLATPPPPRLADLVIPLATLLGLAERAGEGHGLGPLDPGLCRSLAAAAADSPHSTVCVTITDADGIAIGHGCARPARPARRPALALVTRRHRPPTENQASENQASENQASENPGRPPSSRPG